MPQWLSMLTNFRDWCAQLNRPDLAMAAGRAMDVCRDLVRRGINPDEAAEYWYSAAVDSLTIGD